MPSLLSAASQNSFTAAWQCGTGWNCDLHTIAARALEAPVLQGASGAAPGTTVQTGAKVGWCRVVAVSLWQEPQVVLKALSGSLEAVDTDGM